MVKVARVIDVNIVALSDEEAPNHEDGTGHFHQDKANLLVLMLVTVGKGEGKKVSGEIIVHEGTGTRSTTKVVPITG